MTTGVIRWTGCSLRLFKSVYSTVVPFTGLSLMINKTCRSNDGCCSKHVWKEVCSSERKSLGLILEASHDFSWKTMKRQETLEMTLWKARSNFWIQANSSMSNVILYHMPRQLYTCSLTALVIWLDWVRCKLLFIRIEICAEYKLCEIRMDWLGSAYVNASVYVCKDLLICSLWNTTANPLQIGSDCRYGHQFPQGYIIPPGKGCSRRSRVSCHSHQGQYFYSKYVSQRRGPSYGLWHCASWHGCWLRRQRRRHRPIHNIHSKSS